MMARLRQQRNTHNKDGSYSCATQEIEIVYSRFRLTILLHICHLWISIQITNTLPAMWERSHVEFECGNDLSANFRLILVVRNCMTCPQQSLTVEDMPPGEFVNHPVSNG